MSYVTKQFTKFQTVGTAIKLSETFVSLKKLTAQNITKRYMTQQIQKETLTDKLEEDCDCNCGF